MPDEQYAPQSLEEALAGVEQQEQEAQEQEAQQQETAPQSLEEAIAGVEQQEQEAQQQEAQQQQYAPQGLEEAIAGVEQQEQEAQRQEAQQQYAPQRLDEAITEVERQESKLQGVKPIQTSVIYPALQGIKPAKEALVTVPAGKSLTGSSTESKILAEWGYDQKQKKLAEELELAKKQQKFHQEYAGADLNQLIKAGIVLPNGNFSEKAKIEYGLGTGGRYSEAGTVNYPLFTMSTPEEYAPGKYAGSPYEMLLTYLSKDSRQPEILVKLKEKALEDFKNQASVTGMFTGTTRTPDWGEYNYEDSIYREQWLKMHAQSRGFVPYPMTDKELKWWEKLFKVTPLYAAPPESEFFLEFMPRIDYTGKDINENRIIWSANSKWYALSYSEDGQFTGYAVGDRKDNLNWSYSTPTNPIDPEVVLKCTTPECNLDNAELKLTYDWIKEVGLPRESKGRTTQNLVELPDNALTRNDYGIVLDKIALKDSRYNHFVNAYSGMTYVPKASLSNILDTKPNEYNVILLGRDGCGGCEYLYSEASRQGLINKYDNVNWLFLDSNIDGTVSKIKDLTGSNFSVVPDLIIVSDGKLVEYTGLLNRPRLIATGADDGMEFIQEAIVKSGAGVAGTIKEVEKPRIANIPPVIESASNYTATFSPDKTKVTVTWETDKPTIGSIGICNSNLMCSWGEKETVPTTKHSVTATISPEEVYHLTLETWDATENKLPDIDAGYINKSSATEEQIRAYIAHGQPVPEDLRKLIEPKAEKPTETKPSASTIKPPTETETPKTFSGKPFSDFWGKIELESPIKKATEAKSTDIKPENIKSSIEAYEKWNEGKDKLLTADVLNSPALYDLYDKKGLLQDIATFEKSFSDTVSEIKDIPPSGQLSLPSLKSLKPLEEQGYKVVTNPSESDDVWIFRPSGEIISAIPEVGLAEMEALSKQQEQESKEYQAQLKEYDARAKQFDNTYNKYIVENDLGIVSFKGDESTYKAYQNDFNLLQADYEKIKPQGDKLASQYETLALSSTKLQSDGFLKQTGEYIKAHPAEFAVGFVPVLGTAVLWNKMGGVEKGISVAGDALFFVPAIKGVSAGVRAGESIAKAVGRVAWAEAKVPITIVTKPKATLKTLTEPVITAISPKHIPIEATEIRSYILKIPISRVGEAGDTLKARDLLTHLAETGEKPVIEIAGKEIELARTALQSENLEGVAVHTSPDLRSFLNGADFDNGFLSPNLSTRLTIASATGKSYTPSPQVSAWEFVNRHIDEIGQYHPQDIMELDLPVVRAINLADAKNIPANIAPEIKQILKQNKATLYGSYTEWLKSDKAIQPNDIDILVDNPSGVRQQIASLARKNGYDVKITKDTIALRIGKEYKPIADVHNLDILSEMYDARGLKPATPKTVEGIKVIPLGEQYLRQSFGAEENVASASKRKEHVLKMSKAIEGLIEEAGYTKKMPGALIIRDKELLSQLKSSGVLYKTSAEIESVLKAKLPPPSQILKSINTDGTTLNLFVIGEKYTPAQIAQLKFRGSIDTVRDIFRPAIKYKNVEKLSDRLSDLSQESKALQRRINIARKADDTTEVQRLESELSRVSTEARRLAGELNRVYAPTVHPLMVSTGDYLDIENYRLIAVEKPTEMARYLSTLPVSERTDILRDLPNRSEIERIITETPREYAPDRASIGYISTPLPDRAVPPPKEFVIPLTRTDLTREPIQANKLEIPKPLRIPQPELGIKIRTITTVERKKKLEDLNKQQVESMIGWKQGWCFKYIYYPYRQEDVFNSREPLPDIPIYKGADSAFKSVRLLRGQKLEKPIRRDMGIVDLTFDPTDKRDPRLTFEPDPNQETTVGQGITEFTPPIMMQSVPVLNEADFNNGKPKPKAVKPKATVYRVNKAEELKPTVSAMSRSIWDI